MIRDLDWHMWSTAFITTQSYLMFLCKMQSLNRWTMGCAAHRVSSCSKQLLHGMYRWHYLLLTRPYCRLAIGRNELGSLFAEFSYGFIIVHDKKYRHWMSKMKICFSYISVNASDRLQNVNAIANLFRSPIHVLI